MLDLLHWRYDCRTKWSFYWYCSRQYPVRVDRDLLDPKQSTYDRERELTRTLLRFIAPLHICAGVAELVEAPDLGSGIFGCGGSSPLSRTK